MRRQPIYTGSAVLGRGAYTDLESETSAETVDSNDTSAKTATAADEHTEERRPRRSWVENPLGANPDQRGGYPYKSLIVISNECSNGSGQREYRIGIMTAKDFKHGLSDPKRADILRLNPVVAKHCFGASPVYSSDTTAVAEVTKLWPEADCGVKILQFRGPFPN
jgi:hypothetical protein